MEKNKIITNILFLYLVGMQINIDAITPKQQWLIGGGIVFILHNVLTLAFMSREYISSPECLDIYNEFDQTKNVNQKIDSEGFKALFTKHQIFLSKLFSTQELNAKKQSMAAEPTDAFMTQFQKEIKGKIIQHKNQFEKKNNP